jgi:hypothetical protein
MIRPARTFSDACNVALSRCACSSRAAWYELSRLVAGGGGSASTVHSHDRGVPGSAVCPPSFSTSRQPRSMSSEHRLAVAWLRSGDRSPAGARYAPDPLPYATAARQQYRRYDRPAHILLRRTALKCDLFASFCTQPARNNLDRCTLFFYTRGIVRRRVGRAGAIGRIVASRRANNVRHAPTATASTGPTAYQRCRCTARQRSLRFHAWTTRRRRVRKRVERVSNGRA